MKSYNKVFTILLGMLLTILLILQFVIVPKLRHEDTNIEVTSLQPTKHNIESVFRYENDYMGNNSNTINLFGSLPLSDESLSFKMDSKKLEVIVSVDGSVANIGEEKVKQALIYDATAAFALLHNMNYLTFEFKDVTYQTNRTLVEAVYETLNQLLDKDTWSTMVQKPLEDINYVEQTFLGMYLDINE